MAMWSAEVVILCCLAVMAGSVWLMLIGQYRHDCVLFCEALMIARRACNAENM